MQKALVNAAVLFPDAVSFRASDRCHRRGNLPDERYRGTTSLAPRIYEGGGPRSGRGSPPAAAGKASSVTASPCQLPRRGSRGRCAPFLPPAFLRGEGREAAGGVLRGGGESLLSHGFAVPAPPEGKPRVLRTVLAPRIYEGGGPRSGRGSPPPPRGKPPQSRLRRASSPGGEAEGAARRSPVPFNRELAHGMVFPERVPVLFRFSAFYSGPRPVRRSGCFFRWRRGP